MHRIDNSTAAASLPIPVAAGTPGYFTKGDPVGGVAATIVSDDWCNAVQEEISNAIEGAGVTLSKTDRSQLSKILNFVSETVVGLIKVATQALTDAGTNDTTAVTPKKLKNGFVSNITVNGYVKFPSWLGAFILQWGTTPTSTPGGGGFNVSYPLAFPNANYVVMATGGATSTSQLAYSGTDSAGTGNSLTGFRFWVPNSGALPGNWFAIGR